MPKNEPDVVYLAGARVLVAEDEAVIALDIETLLRDVGCVVLGPATSVADTLLLLASERPDAALLDAELSDGWATPVAEACAAQGVPFALLTGYSEAEITEPILSIAPRLTKPFGSAALLQLLILLLATEPPSGVDEPA